MTEQRLDELSKAVAQPTSRRRAFKMLAAAAGGGALSLIGAAGTSAAPRCRDQGEPCQSDAQCCSRFCDNTTFRCGPAQPPPCTKQPNGTICTSNNDCCSNKCQCVVATNPQGNCTGNPQFKICKA